MRREHFTSSPNSKGVLCFVIKIQLWTFYEVYGLKMGYRAGVSKGYHCMGHSGWVHSSTHLISLLFLALYIS